MLKQKYVKSRKVCKVTFELPKKELPPEVEAQEVKVVGDFNNWDANATPMKRIKSTGAYKIVVELEPEKVYQFRYLINDDCWLNDATASAYVSNGFGSQNGVVKTSMN
ncbi:MAG: isoamylase early set domain-containing protein [Chloroflexota bacterium]